MRSLVLLLVVILLAGCGSTVQSRTVTLPGGASVTTTDTYTLVAPWVITSHSRVQELPNGLRIRETNTYFYRQFVKPEAENFGPVVIPPPGYQKKSIYY